jgi:cyclopropane fatty-acyl-phospholipid synthase-like methyltransferase
MLARAAAATGVLEIGCGWGALAEAAARASARTVTGITLVAPSSWTTRRAAPGTRLAWPRAPTCGCRTTATSTTGPSTPSCSIEMFEAVGREYWASYFADACARQLKPGGRACIQTITIRDDLFERYIALAPTSSSSTSSPAACCPAPQSFRRAGAARAGLQVSRRTRPSARTTPRPCGAGARQFLADSDAQVRSWASTTRFMRIWEFYLAYCEAAFDDRQHRRRAVHAAEGLRRHALLLAHSTAARRDRAVRRASDGRRAPRLLDSAAAIGRPGVCTAQARRCPRLQGRGPPARLQGRGGASSCRPAGLRHPACGAEPVLRDAGASRPWLWSSSTRARSRAR